MHKKLKKRNIEQEIFSLPKDENTCTAKVKMKNPVSPTVNDKILNEKERKKEIKLINIKSIKLKEKEPHSWKEMEEEQLNVSGFLKSRETAYFELGIDFNKSFAPVIDDVSFQIMLISLLAVKTILTNEKYIYR